MTLEGVLFLLLLFPFTTHWSSVAVARPSLDVRVALRLSPGREKGREAIFFSSGEIFILLPSYRVVRHPQRQNFISFPSA